MISPKDFNSLNLCFQLMIAFLRAGIIFPKVRLCFIEKVVQALSDQPVVRKALYQLFKESLHKDVLSEIKKIESVSDELIADYRPINCEQNHWREWLDSGVEPEIVELNVKSLSGLASYDYLFYSPQISRRNDGRLRDGELKRYRHLEAGGWWCSGINLLTFEDSLWGCFKPNKPRLDGNGKTVKYEHPIKTTTEIFALRVPAHIWQWVARRYDIALPDGYKNLSHAAFWQWVIANPIPLIVCEGAKKAAALLSCGYVAVALPGIFNGFRQPKDEFGEPIGNAVLIEQLQVFAQLGRRIYFCYDQDTKRRTVRNVNQALAKTAKLFINRGCEAKVIAWSPTLGKGVDDVIKSHGRESFDELYRNASSFDDWQTGQLKWLTYQVDLILNQRYLGEFLPPNNKQFICLKAPKGSGKTEWLRYITDSVIRSGERKVLLLTHRVQLSTQTANRLGIPYITEVVPEGRNFGIGMCIDSLHPNSQAKFNPDEWKGAWLILDEVQQVIWHLLNSSTCQSQRVAIIKTLKQLLLNIINHGGKIFIADADLNDTSIDFIKGLLGLDIEPWIVENIYKFQQPWSIYHFTDKNPSRLVKSLENRLNLGEKHLLCVSGQKAKSKWGSRNLEAYYCEKKPNLRILRIDSETVADPNHPAFGCVANINEIVRDTEWWETYTCPINACPINQSIVPVAINESSSQLAIIGQEQTTQQVYPHCQLYPEIEFRERRDYDLVICTPTIETGVSIEVPHFDGVWGIFQGIQTTDSVRQHLSRDRVPVPRYVWIKEVGIGRIGNGANTVKGLLAGEYKKDKAIIRQLMEVGFQEAIDRNFEPICIETWAKMGTLINLGMKNYARQIIDDLASEGHLIFDANVDGIFSNDGSNIDLPSESDSEQLKEEISLTRDQEYLKHRESVVAAEIIPSEKYEKLSRQQSKTEKERLEYQRGTLERRYEVPVTPELVERDDCGWYSQIRLHYYFDEGRQHLFEREKSIMSIALKNGDGDYFKPDTNSKSIVKKIAAFDWLGFDGLLKDGEFSNQHSLIQEIFDKCMAVNPKTGRQDNLYIIKLVLGIDLSKEKYPMALCQRVVGLIGYRFPFLRREGSRGNRIRIYGKAASEFLINDVGKLVLDAEGRAVSVSDGREEVFVAWLLRDAAAVEKAASEKLLAQQSASVNTPHSEREMDQVEMLVEFLPDTNDAEMLQQLISGIHPAVITRALQRVAVEVRDRITAFWQQLSGETQNVCIEGFSPA